MKKEVHPDIIGISGGGLGVSPISLSPPKLRDLGGSRAFFKSPKGIDKLHGIVYN